jgi:hypothetical protein
MSTAHKLIKSTRPQYATGSGLMLEMRRDNAENWSKLKDAEPYSRNREVSLANQIKALEDVRDGWVSRGTTEYRTAQYRIGRYKYAPEHQGYVWVDASKLLADASA